MLTVEGLFKDGSDLELNTMGIDKGETMVLRDKFATFEDWNDPKMDVYNDYDNAKAVLTKHFKLPDGGHL